MNKKILYSIVFILILNLIVGLMFFNSINTLNKSVNKTIDLENKIRVLEEETILLRDEINILREDIPQ